jgi:hypothetical protein
LPMSFETIQYFRATFSYDAIVIRLNKDINVTKEWTTYAREAAKEARLRVQKNMQKRRYGLTDMDYLQIEQLVDMSTQFIFQLQRNVENPIIQFKNIVGKIAYIASLFMTINYWVAAVVGLGLLVDTISRRGFGYRINWDAIIEAVTSFGWVQMGLIFIVLVIIRRIVLRLNLPDSRLNPER